MKPICKPVVNTQLERMNSLQRTAEAFRYIILSIEWWIAPSGSLRQWIKVNTRLAAFMSAPTFMAFPVVMVALWELESAMKALTTIVGKLIFLPILTLLAFVSITVAFKIIGVFIKR